MEDKEVIEYYNSISEGYQELYKDEQIAKIRRVLGYIPKDKLILDVGSGDGLLSEFVENSMIIALDISFNMLKKNPVKIKINANAKYLPFRDNSIDLITSFTVIQDISNFKKAIAEFWRVLSKNGRLIVSYLKRSEKSKFIEATLCKKFNIIKVIEEEKDIIIICNK